jgi:hypothetical protein
MFVAVYLVLSLVGAEVRATAPGTTGSRLHPVAMEKALVFADQVDSTGTGRIDEVDVTKALAGDAGVAIVDNLGKVKGSPRVVQYNVRESGAWIRVCVDIPRARSVAPYVVTCPVGATK